MKSQLWILCLLSVVSLTGCQSDRAPSFVSNDDIDQLIPAARDVAVAEVEANFGSPSNLVVASYLNVDFGTYSGTVEKVKPDGSYRVRLNPQSPLASEERMAGLKGAAVTIAASKSAESTEAPAASEAPAKEGESSADEKPQVLQVVSFTVSPTQDEGEGVVGDLTVVSTDGTAVTVNEKDVVTVIGDTLQHGRNLYLRHCMHCHGVSGDGAGPTAQYFTIKPRDYRLGKFKFTSTKGGVRASRDDLYRIIKLGIPGTYMPSFMLLPDSESRAITEYIRWLAMRGEMEGMVATQFSDFSVDRLKEEDAGAVEKEFNDDWAANASDYRTQIEGDLKTGWTDSEDEQNVIWPLKKKAPDADPPDLELVPAPRKVPTSESIANGRRLFMHKDIACFSCHGETARGNGVSTETRNKNLLTNEMNEKPGLYDDWGNLVKPRDLTSGIFRGGRRPIDLYRRIHTGIKGTPMQGFGGKSLDGDEIWDIVNYVLSIPVHGATPESSK
ncbi:MAG: cytochrome c [Planctomycetota bacterium]|nr:cytochrome c [Planctomycetota bacterium]